MSAVSSEVAEKARKFGSTVLTAISKIGQIHIASQIGLDDSAVSRFISDEKDMSRALQILAAAGLKVVPNTHICVAKPMYEALVTIAAGAMNNPETVQKLVWEEN